MPMPTACPACSARATDTTVRDHGMGGVDTTLGLTDLGEGLWACLACGQGYRCRVEKSEPPHYFVDYDLYSYEKTEPILPRGAPPAPPSPVPPSPALTVVPAPVYRCPQCRSLDVGRDPERSAYELTYMACAACGYGERVDWVGRDEWVIRVQDQEDARVARAAAAAPPAPVAVKPAVPVAATVAPAATAAATVSAEPDPEFGCVMCTGDDAEEAWEALETTQVRTLVREVHFGVDLKRCYCDQIFAVVFTERVDYRDGEDDQTWLAVPITEAERARLQAADPSAVPGALVAVARHRRFLAKSRGVEAPWWSEGGFTVMPHD